MSGGSEEIARRFGIRYRHTVLSRVMVWEDIGYTIRTSLDRIDSNLNADRYIFDILRPVSVLYLRGQPNANKIMRDHMFQVELCPSSIHRYSIVAMSYTLFRFITHCKHLLVDC